MSRPVVAVVGAGSIAPTHAKNLRGGARLRFAARRPESARRLAARFGGEPLEGGFEEALERPEVRGVVLATPAEQHAGQILAALAAGKSVLAEKPMTTDFAAVERIGEALAGRPPGSLMVAENYAYRPVLRLLRPALAEIGPIRTVRLRKVTNQRSPGWRERHGALLEGGIHLVAFLGALLDSPLDSPPSAEAPSVRAEFPGPARPERHSITRIEYPSGVEAEVRYGWDRPSLPGGILQHSSVEGERGRVVFETNGLYVLVRRRRFFRLRSGPLADLLGFAAMARDFLAVLRDPSRPPKYGFPEARRDLAVVERAYSSLD